MFIHTAAGPSLHSVQDLSPFLNSEATTQVAGPKDLWEAGGPSQDTNIQIHTYMHVNI